MGAWDNAKEIPIPQKPLFRVRVCYSILEVGRSHVLELRQSDETGNTYVKYRDEKGRVRYGLLESPLRVTSWEK